MNLDHIFKRFCQLAQLTEEQGTPWRYLCSGAMEELKRLLPPEDWSTQTELLETVGGGLAWAEYLLHSQGGETSGQEIKVGDIMVKNTSATSGKTGWQTVRHHFLEQISPLLPPPVGIVPTERSKK